MKSRMFLFGLMAVVSLTSGCACCDNPCWGFRLHPWANHGGGCGSCCGGCPAYSSPVSVGPVSSSPVVYRPGTIGIPEGPSCCGGGPMIPPSVGFPAGYPPMPYTPVIGNPMPLPGTATHDVVPSIMPGGK
jgi:hypothetical protein